MFQHLHIPNRKERWLVGTADIGLAVMSRIGSAIRSAKKPPRPPERILLLRLERVGDLLMVFDAIAMVRTLAPQAQIDLVVGSWNLPLARLIPAVDSIEMLDVPWMARERPGRSWAAMVRQARGWRSRRYDLAINFEPDIRSNLLLALSGATRRVGFFSGGGGDVLTRPIASEPSEHVAVSAERLVAHAFDLPSIDVGPQDERRTARKLNIPDDARRRAAELIEREGIGGRLLVGIQPAAGRKVKEWDPIRFAEVGAELARARGAKIVLIGSVSDRTALDAVRAAWPRDVARVDLPPDTDLVVLAAVLERLALFITGDTGPMHLAAAVGTSVLAIFGPSLPTRYAPLSAKSRIVRIDIPCSPCNRMRQPPERCVGIIPDCLSGIQTVQVLQAANEMLDGHLTTSR